MPIGDWKTQQKPGAGEPLGKSFAPTGNEVDPRTNRSGFLGSSQLYGGAQRFGGMGPSQPISPIGQRPSGSLDSSDTYGQPRMYPGMAPQGHMGSVGYTPEHPAATLQKLLFHLGNGRFHGMSPAIPGITPEGPWAQRFRDLMTRRGGL